MVASVVILVTWGLLLVLAGWLFMLVHAWALPGVLLVASAGCLVVAVVKEQRAAGAAQRLGMHCTSCGAIVPTGAAVCPRCQGVDIAMQPRGAGYERRQARAIAALYERQRQLDSKQAWIAWLPAASFWQYLSWYGRGVMGVGYVEEGSPAALRWWSSRLLLVAGVLGMLVAAGEFDTWLAALPVLLASAAASAAVARTGDRAL